MKHRFFFVFIFLLFGNAYGQVIDLSKVSNGAILEKKIVATKPNEKGIIESQALLLPKYTRGVYYTGLMEKSAQQPYGNRTFGFEFKDLEQLVLLLKTETHQTYDGFDVAPLFCLDLETQRYMCVLAIAGEAAFSSFTVRHNSIWVDSGTFGTDEYSGVLPQLAYAFGETPHEASLNAWKLALKSKSIKSKTTLRSDKTYPEYLNYFGYNSWEHFRKNITEEKLAKVIKDMEKAPLPMRWMLVDMGYEELDNQRLVSFQPDKKNFPNGLEALASLKSENGVRWLGLWWHMSGFHGGVSPDHKISELEGHLEQTGSRWLPKFNQESSDLFYQTRAKQAKAAGIDFLKVDYQTNNFNYQVGQKNPIQAMSYQHRALEKAWQDNFDGLTNCIAQHHIHLFKQEKSAVIRTSKDFFSSISNNRDITIQNLRNSIYVGNTHWPDYDMFISSFQTGKANAELRALSGSPLYVSEEIRKINFEYISPATWSDGSLLRPIAPGTLTPDGFFEKPETAGLRVVAPLAGGAASFWLANYHSDKPLDLSLAPEDYRFGGLMIQPYKGLWKSPKEGLVAYDYHAGKAWNMEKTFTTTLNAWETKIIHLLPIKKGWAVIGRPDKYLSPVSYQVVDQSKSSITLTSKEHAPFLLWSEHGELKSKDAVIEKRGEKLFAVVPNAGVSKIKVYRDK